MIEKHKKYETYDKYWLKEGEIKEKDGEWHIRASKYIPSECWLKWLYEQFQFDWKAINFHSNLRTFVFKNYEDAILFKMVWL